MFEQLVDAHGRVLRSATGPAHVPASTRGATAATKCVGCHLGHSAIAVARSYQIGKRFNASTSARATASSEVASARQAIDRRTRGATERVAWIASPEPAASIRLAWPMALAVDSLIVYGVRPDPEHGTDLRVDGCEVRLLRDGRVVRRLRIDGVLSPDGSGLDCGSIEIDAAEIVLGPATGTVNARPATGLTPRSRPGPGSRSADSRVHGEARRRVAEAPRARPTLGRRPNRSPGAPQAARSRPPALAFCEGPEALPRASQCNRTAFSKVATRSIENASAVR